MTGVQTCALPIFNWCNYKNDKLDALAAASSKEPDPAKREQFFKAALREHADQVHPIPLHRQVIPWSMRSNVTAAHRADNWLEWRWVTVDKGGATVPKPDSRAPLSQSAAVGAIVAATAALWLNGALLSGFDTVARRQARGTGFAPPLSTVTHRHSSQLSAR